MSKMKFKEGDLVYVDLVDFGKIIYLGQHNKYPGFTTSRGVFKDEEIIGVIQTNSGYVIYSHPDEVFKLNIKKIILEML